MGVVEVIVVVVVGILAVIAAVLVQEGERKQLQAWVAAREWTLSPTPAGGPWLAVLPDRGRGRLRLELQARVGTAAGGRAATVAWYVWETSTHGTDAAGNRTTSTRKHHATVYVTASPRPLPDLAVVRRGIGSSLARSLGLSGAPDTGIADFDEHFRIDSESGRDIVPLLPPALLAALLAGTVPPFACRAGELVVWTGDRFDPDRVDAMLPAVGRLVDLIGAGQGQWRERATG